MNRLDLTKCFSCKEPRPSESETLEPKSREFKQKPVSYLEWVASECGHARQGVPPDMRFVGMALMGIPAFFHVFFTVWGAVPEGAYPWLLFAIPGFIGLGLFSLVVGALLWRVHRFIVLFLGIASIPVYVAACLAYGMHPF